MTKLRTLRSQLASLRNSRQFMRLGTGYAALVIALLWILLGIFILDFGFQLVELQRAIVIAIGVAALVWAAMKFTAPFLGQKETVIDMALLVERQQGIDSDLVAALQFESQDADQWGSRELEDAVVDYVAQLDRGLNVYEGISHEQFWKRVGILVATIAVVVGLAAYKPGHAHAFLMRLALDDLHYPSNTQIERVLVNGSETLSRSQHGTSPQKSEAVQGRPVIFAAWADGDVPATGEVRVFPAAGGAREITLEKIVREDLQAARQAFASQLQLEEAVSETATAELTPEQRVRVANTTSSVTGLDVARLEQALQTDDPHDEVKKSAWRGLKQIDDVGSDAQGQLFIGKLPRMLDPAEYSVRLGDAWTDRAKIEMIALPFIEPNFTETPPDYARRADQEQSDPASLQRSVIEGSQLELTIESTKPLEEARFAVITTVDGVAKREVLSFESAGDDGKHWRLKTTDTALADVREPFRFEIQVADEDGLSLESPLRGAVRLKADRPPRISGSLVHRVLLPTASPEVELRVDDDYGIDAINVRVSVLRGEDSSVEPSAQSEATFAVSELLPLRGNKSPSEAAQRQPTVLKFPLQGEQLPRVGAYELDISSLALERGDEVRIVLEAIDYRGRANEGVSAESEPIILDITDESGILAAVSEGDRRSQEQIDDLIRRQLGIGEAP